MNRQEKALSASDKATLRENWIKLRREYFDYIPLTKIAEDCSADGVKLESNTKPNVGLVLAIKDLMACGIKSQREIALDVGVSQTRLSKFMNSMVRIRGWHSMETKIFAWLDEFHDICSRSDKMVIEGTKSAPEPNSGRIPPDATVSNISEGKQPIEEYSSTYMYPVYQEDSWEHFSINQIFGHPFRSEERFRCKISI